MTDATTYGLGQILTSPLALIGLALILGVICALAWIFRGHLGYYQPEIPAAAGEEWLNTYGKNGASS